jgi:apolipoprotein N-acyltransferase
VSIAANPDPTFYVRHGEWFAYICVGVMTLTLAVLILRRITRRAR